MDPILNPLLTLVTVPNNPFFGAIIGVFIIATIVAFVITLANKLLVDQDRLQFLQKEMKGYQQDMMKAQKSGDPKAMAEMQKKQSRIHGHAEGDDVQLLQTHDCDLHTHNHRILLDGWKSTYNPDVCELPTFAYYVLLVPIFHTFYHQSAGVPVMAIEWLGWYILCSFAMSLIFRKLLGLKGGGM